MNIPRHVMIMGRRVPVRMVPNLRDGGEECFGLFDGKCIKLCSTSKHNLNATLLHEQVHAVLAFSGLTELLTPQLEEAICVAMESLA